ncbi:MAG: GNAT family N-acetyltransferase [Alphaproteobacteria bacterium]|nr:GNAT family N-acetyltransferase [Alphaproteobacteria bacterium]
MTDPFDVRPMQAGEDVLWGAMRALLWPDCGPEDNAQDMATLADPAGALRVVFLAVSGTNAVGFAEISERSVVAGAGNGPAAHLEGWWVAPEFRRSGVGRALIRAAADWARSAGYAFFSSDVEIDNPVSRKAHEALGFVEQGRVVNYLMALDK